MFVGKDAKNCREHTLLSAANVARLHNRCDLNNVSVIAIIIAHAVSGSSMTNRRRKAFNQAWLAARIALIICVLPSTSRADGLHVPLQIWFVRHAESELNDDAYSHSVADSGISYPLTERGIAQANLVADQLVGHSVLEVYSSTRLRAIQTADAIAFRLGMALKLAPEAVEIDLDSPSGTSDMKGVYTDLTHRWIDGKESEARNGNGESLLDLQRRFLPFVREVMNRHADDSGTIVIVSHSATLALMIPMLAANVPPKFALTHTLANGAVVKTELRDGRLYCTDWADVPAASLKDP
jgi:2,3-bisphosphoglycerate-dependent phosphoglycerate mutase